MMYVVVPLSVFISEKRTKDGGSGKALMNNAFQYPHNRGSVTLRHFLINIQQQGEAFPACSYNDTLKSNMCDLWRHSRRLVHVAACSITWHLGDPSRDLLLSLFI